jgi:hypothetical protein
MKAFLELFLIKRSLVELQKRAAVFTCFLVQCSYPGKHSFPFTIARFLMNGRYTFQTKALVHEVSGLGYYVRSSLLPNLAPTLWESSLFSLKDHLAVV